MITAATGLGGAVGFLSAADGNRSPNTPSGCSSSPFFYFLPSYCGHSTSAPTPLPPQPGGSNPPFPFLPPLSPFLSRTKEELWGGKAGRSVNGYVERVIDVAWRWKPQVAGPLRRNQRCFLFFILVRKAYPIGFQLALQQVYLFLHKLSDLGYFFFYGFYLFFFLHFNCTYCAPIKYF